MTQSKALAFAAQRLVGRRIWGNRKYMRLSQTDLAAMLGQRQSVVSEWEKGRRGISLADAWALAALFGVPVGVFLGPPIKHERERFEDDVRDFERRLARGPSE